MPITYTQTPVRPSRPPTLFSSHELRQYGFQLNKPELAHVNTFGTKSQISDNSSELTRVGSSRTTFEKPYLSTCIPDQPVKITTKTKFLTWFNPYRKLLCLSIFVNFILLLMAMSNTQSYMRKHLSVMVLGNLLIGFGVRSEWILRFLYWSSIMCFRWNWVPKKIKIWVVGVLYHIGGLHSGCGVSAFLWLCLSWGDHFLHRELYHGITTGSMFLSILGVLVSCIGASPHVREAHHNFFEATHRFVGWFGILATTVFVISSAWWNPKSQKWQPFAENLFYMEEFWFVMLMIVLIVASWITVMKVPVTFVHTSSKASVLRMPGGLTSGLHTRISRGGLREWHIFGSISEGRNATCHYLVIAVQGDFTRSLNENTPEHLYTKTFKPCGLPYFSRLFQRGVAICTGSGIGAIGSTCIQHESWFLVWIGPDLEKTYGETFMNFIKTRISPNRRIIWDTRISGRPNVPLELERVFRSWKADVALFIGSPALNKSVLQTCRVRKIPVYGSIWDA
ncbi:uncharacterized protein MELLADRAFT_59415 [Melampsora larici-populina 98AG31]|uniref:Uncharacterized protein n=1 Tax=Melampsora larici-populina (strain 98AG31 / pathotype 3-4-7) TaxID=747676 RepID=F4R7E5_MELLP|nr:uncharacterized protein MELLADRAFT_59415 [Melampsora larici-populina 98AG31]EGG11302.1 hypothetical protein MELLADRAFT_59415 [Melampsora larici-populina 98AG31]